MKVMSGVRRKVDLGADLSGRPRLASRSLVVGIIVLQGRAGVRGLLRAVRRGAAAVDARHRRDLADALRRLRRLPGAGGGGRRRRRGLAAAAGRARAAATRAMLRLPYSGRWRASSPRRRCRGRWPRCSAAASRSSTRSRSRRARRQSLSWRGICDEVVAAGPRGQEPGGGAGRRAACSRTWPSKMVEVGRVDGRAAGHAQQRRGLLRRGERDQPDRFVTLIEPVLLVVMGVVIAGLLLSLYMPLFQLSSLHDRHPVMGVSESDERPTCVDGPRRRRDRSVRRRARSERRRARRRDGGRRAARGALPAASSSTSSTSSIDHELFRSIPADLMLRYGFVPYRREGNALVIVVSDPSDLQTIDEVGVQLGTPIRVTVGTPSAIQAHSQEERELAARARGGHRGLPDADSPRRRGRRREPDGRQADVRLEPGHPAGRLDDLHRPPAARVGHPHRDAGRRGAREVPHRRRAAAGDEADRQAAPQHDHLAHQGHGRARHRREARAAGRPLQAARAGQDDRLPRLDHAERARRGRGHPHPRQGVDQRAVHASCGSTSSACPRTS